MSADPVPPGDPDALLVESLDLEGQGVARRADGKVVFIEGALPGERVRAAIARRKNQWEQGSVTEVLASSPLRVLRVRGSGASGPGHATHAAPASRVKPTSQPVSTRVGTASLIAHVRVTTRNPTSPTV